MYSILSKKFLKINYKKKFLKLIKKLNYINWRGFYAFHNFHTQHREGWNITRVYLLNSRLWYFQKKQFLKTSINFKYQKVSILHITNNIIKLESKLNDYNEKI